MKRTLLLSATFMFAMGSFAQLLVDKGSVSKLPTLMEKHQIATSAKKAPGAHKLKSDGIYYVKPYGTFFGGFDAHTGLGFGNTTVILPPFQDLTFTNKSTGKVNWVNTENAQVTADADGNYTDNWGRLSGSAFYLPSIVNRTSSYVLGEWNVYVKRGYVDMPNGLARPDSITSMWVTDPVAAYESSGTFYSPVASWGALDSDNMYGSGTITYEDGSVAVCYAAAQAFCKPASPLFVSEVIVNGETFTQPIAEGKQLYALITKAHNHTFTYSDGSTEEGLLWDLDEVIDTLYASSADTLDFVSESTRNGKAIKNGSVIFTKPGEVDAFGFVSPAPVMVKDTFAIVIGGFEQEGIDFGVDGLQVPDEDVENVNNGRFLVYDVNDPTDAWFHSYSDIALDVSIYGMFDKAVVRSQPQMYTFESEDLDYRVIRVPETGSVDEYGYSNMTEGATASAFITGETTDAGYPGVPVLTNCYWFDEESNANYDIIAPDWISGVAVDTSLYEDTYGMNIVMFWADPLPAGETGRVAEVKIVGREAGDDYSTISETIYILQGDANIDAIAQIQKENKSNNHALYNLNGQRVTKAVKGVYIQDGKKFLKK